MSIQKCENKTHQSSAINCQPNSCPKLSLYNESTEFHNDEMFDKLSISDSISIYSPENRCLKSVALRKDIINKAIIRAMKKFYNKILKFSFSYKGMDSATIYNTLQEHIKNVLASSENSRIHFDFGKHNSSGGKLLIISERVINND